LPRLANGKTDYPKLHAMLAQRGEPIEPLERVKTTG
jgi:hypothetical protein